MEKKVITLVCGLDISTKFLKSLLNQWTPSKVVQLITVNPSLKTKILEFSKSNMLKHSL